MSGRLLYHRVYQSWCMNWAGLTALLLTPGKCGQTPAALAEVRDIGIHCGNTGISLQEYFWHWHGWLDRPEALVTKV